MIPKLLIVDLDGTLLKSDMLHESFWSAFGRNWCVPFLSVLALRRGKAALKNYLSKGANIDVTSLPYNTKTIEYICAHREQGGRTALVTASNQIFANQIAEHLQIFDYVHGSSDKNNLKGSNKADLINEHYSKEDFCYMGDATADLPVWRISSKIITVDALPSVRKQAERLGKPIEHLNTTTRSLQHYIKALRPYQWLKNILVFLPILTSHHFLWLTALNSIVAFIAFNLVASSVYVLNDLLDLNSDREHPRKRLRPFASGAVPIAHGSILALVLLITCVLVTVLLDWKFFLTLAVYYVITFAYSLYLKRKIIIDICVLAGLYTIRIIAGSAATGIELSVWLLAFSIFFFFSLAAVKRQAELVDMLEQGKLMAKGRGYHVGDLPIISMLGLAAGYVSVLVMALYVNSPATVELYSYPPALWGICGVLLYWITRMVLITHRGSMLDDPVVFATKDKVSQICFIIILGFATLGALL